jgi:hypothetical protein
LTLPEEVKQYSNGHPCPNCGEMAERVRISNFSFSFKGGVRGTSGVHGQSGSHDLDYPTLDKAVGRSAEAKYAEYTRRKEIRDKLRQETGINSISQDGNICVPADPRVMQHREKALTLFNKIKKGT